ncbi:MAG: hypothetical protein R3B40_11545 [Polyangiales bacterium]|nr:hypothetical protein [Sandaracinaceae bacterium]
MKKTRYGISGCALVALTALALSGCGLFGPPEPVNQTHNGSLATGDDINSTDGSLQDDYTIRVQQGWVITAVLSAPQFDPYVWILSPNQSNAQQLASQPGTHVVTLTHTAETSGNFIVRANSNTAGQTGDYNLQITAGPPGTAAPAPAPAAAPGAPVPPPGAPVPPPGAPTAPPAQ